MKRAIVAGVLASVTLSLGAAGATDYTAILLSPDEAAVTVIVGGERDIALDGPTRDEVNDRCDQLETATSGATAENAEWHVWCDADDDDEHLRYEVRICVHLAGECPPPSLPGEDDKGDD